MLYDSLYRETGQQRWLDDARQLVAEVDQVLGRKRGYRLGEAPDRDGQYFHYLAMWFYALACLGEHDASYREKGIRIAKDIHRPFVLPGRGVIWKMEEDLSAPYPGYGLGAMDAFDGYVPTACSMSRSSAPRSRRCARSWSGNMRRSTSIRTWASA